MSTLESAVSSKVLLEASETGAGNEKLKSNIYNSFQLSSDSSHTGTSVVTIEVSNDGLHWGTIGTMSVTGNSDTDMFALSVTYKYVRANCTSHGDSTNLITVNMGA